MQVPGQINSIDELREHYREPSQLVQSKIQATIDDLSADFIDRCSFLVLATAGLDGSIDASPRGGPPGFVQRLSRTQIAIPDLNGNNLCDSLTNIVATGWAGVLLIVPGSNETLRVNGRAAVTIDGDILDGFMSELRRPKTAIVIEVAEAFVHCAKAFMRGEVWSPEAWARNAGAPGIVEILGAQIEGLDVDGLRSALSQSYERDLELD